MLNSNRPRPGGTMKKSVQYLISLLVFLTSYEASAIVLKELGQRLSSCQNLEYDDFIVEMDETLKREAQNLFQDDKLTAVVVENPDCFRVGTEIKLFLKNSTIPYLGRALVKELETLNGSELINSKNTPFTRNTLKDFVNATRETQYGILQIRVSEKVEEKVITEQYKRLNTCFPSYGDWEAMRLEATQTPLVSEIKNGRSKAQIWNGTFNCYKIGIRARIQIQGDFTDHGNIIPTELHLVHFTNLTNKHASLMDMSLSHLKSTLEPKKDIDGGYVTMVVYNYEEPLPPEPETERP